MPPPISPNVSASVVVGSDHLLPPWGSASSFIEMPRISAPDHGNYNPNRLIVPITTPSNAVENISSSLNVLPLQPSKSPISGSREPLLPLQPLSIEIPPEELAERDDLIIAYVEGENLMASTSRPPISSSPAAIFPNENKAPLRQNLMVHPEAALRRRSAEIVKLTNVGSKSAPPMGKSSLCFFYNQSFFFISKGVFPKIWGHPTHSIGSTHTTLFPFR